MSTVVRQTPISNRSRMYTVVRRRPAPIQLVEAAGVHRRTVVAAGVHRGTSRFWCGCSTSDATSGRDIEQRVDLCTSIGASVWIFIGGGARFLAGRGSAPLQGTPLGWGIVGCPQPSMVQNRVIRGVHTTLCVALDL
jgi:hypothetical protein